MTYTLHRSECLAVLRTMADNSVDSIVTDPPYGLKFMGKKWDYDVPSVEVWAECLRVLKPGGYLLAFAGTRTQHRMAARIEDAGFEIRDMIAWVYSSGFPKSHNGEWGGTALKPALEPITMARKPLVGTVEENWREHSTGALNIDGCRVAHGGENLNGGRVSTKTEGWDRPWKHDAKAVAAAHARGAESVARAETLGRWPANLIHDGSEEVRNAFPDSNGQQGDLKETGRPRPSSGRFGDMAAPHAHAARIDSDTSAARFFYCAKASRADRNEGLFSSSNPAVGTGATMREREIADWPARNGNFHPTVKPIALMAYLIRLVTPPRGTTLDCYMGSGSTGVAAMREGFDFIGIERDEDENGNPLGYMDIARARIEYELRKPKQNQLDLEATCE